MKPIVLVIDDENMDAAPNLEALERAQSRLAGKRFRSRISYRLRRLATLRAHAQNLSCWSSRSGPRSGSGCLGV